MIQEINPDFIETTLGENRSLPTLVALPPGYKGRLHYPAALPVSVVQQISALDITAMEAYLRHQVVTPAAVCIFLDVRAREILAVLDYQQDAESPNWNQHTLSLKLEYSAEFAPLAALLGKTLSQEDFLNYLDEWGSLFLEKSLLMETVADFRSHHITKVSKVVNQRNGTGKLIVTTDERVDEEVNLPPPQVTALLSLFPAQPRTELPVLIRYRPNNGQVGFTLLITGLEALLLQEIEKLELRLQNFLATMAKVNPDWDKALLLRARVPLLTKPLPTLDVEISGHSLPETLPTLDVEISGHSLPETLRLDQTPAA